MRLVLFGAIAFVLGAAGGTGFAVMRAPAKAPAAPAGADSLAAADSAHVAADAPATPAPDATRHGATAESADSAASAAATSPSAPEPASSSRGKVAPASSPRAEPADRPDAPVVGALMSPDGATLADSCRVVAKVLAAMKPADAAKILNHLSDDQVEGILRASGVRQAGVLLSRLDPERGAALSRRLIVRPEGARR